jgi:hypothetical protein
MAFVSFPPAGLISSDSSCGTTDALTHKILRPCTEVLCFQTIIHSFRRKKESLFPFCGRIFLFPAASSTKAYDRKMMGSFLGNRQTKKSRCVASGFPWLNVRYAN